MHGWMDVLAINLRNLGFKSHLYFWPLRYPVTMSPAVWLDGEGTSFCLKPTAWWFSTSSRFFVLKTHFAVVLSFVALSLILSFTHLSADTFSFQNWRAFLSISSAGYCFIPLYIPVVHLCSFVGLLIPLLHFLFTEWHLQFSCPDTWYHSNLLCTFLQSVLEWFPQCISLLRVNAAGLLLPPSSRSREKYRPCGDPVGSCCFSLNRG